MKKKKKKKKKIFLLLHLFQAINWTHLIETEQINNKVTFTSAVAVKDQL